MSALSLRRGGKPLVLLVAAWKGWLRTDALLVTYILKVLLACLMAAGASLAMELDQPRTAMMTVAIVMQSRSGMVFAKSYYRLMGTLVGIFASFVLVALFAQERILFLSCMAVWIGLCTAGSMIFRNHQSYAFVLAGYTLCIVGLPATVNPAQTFDIGVARITEMTIGLVCAALVSDLIFPQRMWDVMLNSVRLRFGDFSDMLRSALRDPTAFRTSQPALMRFIGDVFSLESYRASAILENDDSRAYRLMLGHLNVEFVEVSTSFHAFEQLMRRQYRSRHPEVVAALLEVYRHLCEAVALDGRSARTEDEAVMVAGRMAAFCNGFDRIVAAARQKLPQGLDEVDALGFETGVELIQRLTDELRVYIGTYASLAGKREVVRRNVLASAPPRLEMHYDPLAVALAGLRGALALALMASLWIAVDWRSGIEAITIGVVTSTLFATAPSPYRTIRHFTLGALIGTVLACLCNFVLLPHAQGFEMLALAIAPGIILAAWFTTRQEYSVVGAGIFIIFLMHLGFNATYNADPVAFMNDAIADLLAVLMSGAMYRLIDFGSSGWSRRRTARGLRNLVVSACRDPLALRRIRLETSARDLVQRAGSARRPAEPQDRIVIEWLLSALEIGNAVIRLREQMQEIGDAAPCDELASALDAIARLYEAPSEPNRTAAIAEVDRARAGLAGSASQNAAHGQLMTTLHFIHSALLDEESILTAGASSARRNG